MVLKPGTYQTDGPGSQVQEAPEQVQSPESMDLAEENLPEVKGQRSKIRGLEDQGSHR